MSDYYDWQTTFAYDADVTMVVSMRGKGKTYGLRKQFVKDFLKDGSRFVEVCRFKDEVTDVMKGYFEKLEENGEFPDCLFKTENKAAYIAKKPADGAKPEWKQIGYFIPLTQMQRSKKKTFVNVHRILMDEAVLMFNDRYHSYLPGEFALLTNVVDSCSRERAGEKRKHKPHVYLLANACDLMNPYFARYGVKEEPKYGYSWHDGKTFLLHYVEPGAEAEAKLNDTVAGRMARGTAEADIIARNKFANANMDFIASKPARAKFHFGIKYRDETFGVWCDWQEGYYYVNEKIPNNARAPVYALTASDNGVNYVAAKRADKAMKAFVELYYLGIVRYETPALREKMMRALSLFGVR
nr:MAG TPA: DNA encapsidation protein [Bacteriophage sp.]